MITIRSPLKKTLLLLTLTTLTISLGTAVSFNNPGDDDVFDADADISVDSELSDTSSVDNITLNGTGADGTDEFTLNKQSDSNYTGTFNKGDAGGTNGDYTLEARLYEGGSITDTDTITITMETSSPDVSSAGDDEFVSQDPEVEFDISDEYSDIESVDASVSSSDGDVSVDDINDDCSGESECSANVQVDTSDLDDGDQFSVDLEATDEAGNTGSNDPEFTIDDEWDGDSSANVEWVESGSDVLTGFVDEDQDLDIEFTPDSVSDTSLTCEVDGDEVDSDSVSASDEDETATCEFDSDEYASSVFDLTVEAEDEAGNTQTLVEDKELVWDTERPSVDSIEQPEGVSTFNSAFDLDVLLSDDASGIETLEYYFDANTDVGSGNSVSLDDSGATTVEKTFTVEPGDLGQGSHTVYVRAEDGTGQTDVSEFDFEYYPNREPEINLGGPDSFEVTSGESKSFTLTIENGAPFFLNGVEVSGSGAVWDGKKTATSLEEGDSVEKSITIDASNLDVGVYNLTLQTANYDTSQTVEVIVRATESQQQSIESDLQEWKNRRDKLNENISKIGNLESGNENVSQFSEKVDQAQKAVDNGNYYEAKSHLQNIDSDFEKASQTFSEKKEIFQKKQRNQMYLIGFFLLVLIGGGGVTAYLYSGEEDISELIPEDWDIELPDEIPEFGVVEKIEALIGEAEEEVEEDTGYSFK